MTVHERRATEALDVPLKELAPFDVLDPFNHRRLQGFICRRSDHRYGALYITHVDERPVPQLVLAVPKFPYPFDKQGTFHFPKGVTRVEAYEKLDGTSVFAYHYFGWGGASYVTYKTRLRPVLGESRFGPFLTYWREMLERYPGIPAAVLAYSGYGLAFELFGARNKHLLIYDMALDIRLLFGVQKDATLEPPTALSIPRHPCAYPYMKVARTSEGLANVYKAMQAELEAELTTDDALGGYRGAEGSVWYMSSPDGWRAFKCKPETIEAIHWAAGGLGVAIIRATAYNVLENHDRVTPELIRELLLEEFNTTEIDLSWALIMRVSASINDEAETREKAFSLYEGTGLDFAADPPAVMRLLSAHFPKGKMQYVYALLAAPHQ